MISKPKTTFENFMDMMVDELIAMSDEEVIDGGNPDIARAFGVRLMASAKAIAGQRRLATAKAGAAILNHQHKVIDFPEVSIEEARRYIAQASNDNKYTLAARSLSELTNDEALRIYRQLKMLETCGDGSGDI